MPTRPRCVTVAATIDDSRSGENEMRRRKTRCDTPPGKAPAQRVWDRRGTPWSERSAYGGRRPNHSQIKLKQGGCSSSRRAREASREPSPEQRVNHTKGRRSRPLAFHVSELSVGFYFKRVCLDASPLALSLAIEIVLSRGIVTI
jgi:hypothetical protein